jgi:hypothetical protein
MSTNTQPIKTYKVVSELSKDQSIDLAVARHNSKLEDVPPPKFTDSQELSQAAEEARRMIEARRAASDSEV